MNFHITIINPKARKIFLSVTDNLTIKELKEKYMKAQELSNSNFIFLFDGTVLKNDKTLRYYEIKDGDVIISKEELLKIIIKNLKGQNTIFNVSRNMTIRELKETYISAKGYSNSDSCQFKFDGCILNNDNNVSFYEMEDGDVIISNERCG